MAQLRLPSDVAVDRDGNLYIADLHNQRVRKVTPAGIISTVAGFGWGRWPTDLKRSTPETRLVHPRGVAVDVDGNLYIAESGNHQIRKVTPQGAISTVAGTGKPGFSGDGGPALSAQLSSPGKLAFDADGNLYIVDGSNLRVRKVTPQGIITTVAGNGERGSGGDGRRAVAAPLWPAGLAVDADGNLYIADVGGRIRKVNSEGIITTVAGSGGRGLRFSGDGGPATAAQLSLPSGLAVDSSGNLYIADMGNDRIRRVTTDGVISTFAGVSHSLGDGDSAVAALLFCPIAVDIDPSGNLYIADHHNDRIRKVAPEGVIETLSTAATTDPVQDLIGPGRLWKPRGVTVDENGNVYVFHLSHVRKITPDGVTSTIAGVQSPGFSGDRGPATAAQLSSADQWASPGGWTPTAIASDRQGNLFVADLNNHRIRKITSEGVIDTVVGSGPTGSRSGGFRGDGGLATSARLNGPTGVAVDDAGNLYIADRGNHRIRLVTTGGLIATVAGTGRRGYSLGGGLAVSAQLSSPSVVAVDTDGNLYIADTGNNRIRKVTPDGLISTIAGTGTKGFSGDGGPATAAELHFPTGVAADADGNIYIADQLNHRIRKLTPAPKPRSMPSRLTRPSKRLTEILRRVEGTYRSVRSYYFDVEVSTNFIREGVSVGSQRSKVRLAGHRPGRLHFESRGHQELVVISDGQTTWTYSPKQRAYSQENAGTVDIGEMKPRPGGQLAEGDVTAGMSVILLLQYTNILPTVEGWRIKGQQDLRIDGRKVKCTVVELWRPPVEQKLWIDEERGMILKSVAEGDTANSPARYKRTVKYKSARINQDMPPDLFVFVPPEKAKLVEWLDLPGNVSRNLVGKPAPDITLKTLDGEEVNLRSLRGNVVLLNFWATWCAPCREELPVIAKLHEDYKQDGLLVFGISDEDKGRVKAYLKKQNFTFPTLDDSGRHAHSAYRVHAIPSTFVINRQGVVAKYFRGGRNEKQLLAGLRAAGLM